MIKRIALFIIVAALFVAATIVAQGPPQNQNREAPATNVTFDRLLKTNQEPQNWLTYGGNLSSWRHSDLTEITPANARELELKWVFQSRSLEKHEVTPLVVNGTMYTIQSPNDVIALDAATGKTIWTYSHKPDPAARNCCGKLSRGLAILGDKLFLAAFDARMIAIDAKTGKELWNTEAADPKQGYAFTHAPLVIKDKVIAGTAGGEFGVRGFIAAWDVNTGKEAWRFNTVPGPGDPGHDWDGAARLGDNLYSCSVIALNPDTGKLQWYYQFSPHNEFDWDSTQTPVLADIEWQGRQRKVMLWANRNGMFYVIDRISGEFMKGQPFVKTNWASGFDPAGRPIQAKGIVPTKEGTLVYPGNQGGTNWYPPSFSPHTGLFYIPTWENSSSTYLKGEEPPDFHEGQTFAGLFPRPGARGEDAFGAVRAIDAKTGDKKWDYRQAATSTEAGILTTASNVLFSGGRDGAFYALDARDGKLLWQTNLGPSVSAGPITYQVKGNQY